MPAGYRLKWNGTRIAKKIRKESVRGELLAAEYVLGESLKVVPIDEAALQNSGTASINTQTLVAAISYDTPYAVVQHERLDFRHAPGRTAKYLEGPLNSSGPQVLAIVAAQLRRAMP